MGRLLAVLGLCLLFSTGFSGRGMRGAASEPEWSWPDSLRVTEHYTDALKKIFIEEDTEAGRELLRKALEQDTTYAPAWYQLSKLSPGGSEPATDRAAHAYRLDTLNKWYGELYGQRLIEQRRYDEARQIYEKLVRLDPQNPDNFRLLALLYQQVGKPNEAVEMLDSAEGRFGKHPLLDELKQEMLIALAEYHNQRNDTRAYLAVSKRLFQSEELPIAEKVRIFKQLSVDQRFYRDHFFQMGDLISTLSLRYPQEPQVVELYATHLIYSGEPEQALEVYKLHLDDDPPQLDYYRAIIDIYSYYKRLDSVYRYIDRAIRVFPAETSLYVSRGHAQAYAGAHDEAIASYRTALQYARTDSLKGAIWGHIGDTYNQLWEAEANTKDRRQSFQAYDKALRFYYDNSLVLNNYAYYLGEESNDTRELERALAMSGRAIELTPNNAVYLDTYAWVLFRLGRLQEARRVMQQAISFDRNESPELFLHYGEILAALGEKFMAEIYFRKAIEKGHEETRRIEQRIEALKSSSR